MIKKLLLIFAAFSILGFSFSSFASHSVRGYTRNGTYIAPHRSMDPGEARSSGYSYHNDELVPNY